MAKKMKRLAGLSLLLTLISAWWYLAAEDEILLTFSITFGTIAYHLGMRLCVGTIVDRCFHNRMDMEKGWFRVGPREQRLYEKWGVKRWKDRMPTYDADAFDSRRHSWEEIAQAMCQAELVHEWIILLSFLPILASVWFGALPVFVITSILSACLDAAFVVMQRYNRPRVCRLMQKQASGKKVSLCYTGRKAK